MNCSKLLSSSLLALSLVVGSFAIAGDKPQDSKAGAGQPEMKLPPGWTQEDMQACMVAATPGKMQEHLAKNAGVWSGKNTMWMAPDTEPMKSECTATYSTIMDGRFLKCDIIGEMPGMGPFTGFGVYGFDNVSQKFQATWLDNMGTGMATGTGELSADGKTLTWVLHYTCPITKKPVSMREIETITGPTTKTLDMFGIDPKSGKEFHMMRIDFTKN